VDSKDFFRASKARTERGLSTFDIALDTAINDQIINLPGTLFFLDKSSTGICTVEGNVGQGTSRNPLLASPGFSMFNEQGFADFRISAPAQPGKTLKIVIATGMSIKPGDAVTSGAVSTQTVDAGLVRTINGQAFLGNQNNLAPVAAQNPNVSLYNPVGSGKKLIVESLSFSTTTAQTVVMGDTSTSLASTLGATFQASKYSGGAAPLGQCRYTNQAGAPMVNYWAQFPIAASAIFQLALKEPIVLPEGRGLLLYGATVNTYLQANFEWFEQ
jgi:hypothetical protein